MATERLNDVWLIGATWWQGCHELLLRDNCFCKAMAVSQAFIFHFKCYSILHFAVCQLLCWAFLFFLWWSGLELVVEYESPITSLTSLRASPCDVEGLVFPLSPTRKSSTSMTFDYLAFVNSDSYTVGALYTVMGKILRTSMYLNAVWTHK